MQTGLRKNIIRSIRGSMGRFLAILCIIALGSGFLAGLTVSEDAMLRTADRYLTAQNFYDYRLLSTLGFQEEQLEAVAAIEGVETAEGGRAQDIICHMEGSSSEFVLHTLSLPELINLPTVTAGRLPEKPGECLADSNVFSEEDIGKVICLSDTNDPDDLDFFTRRKFTIVGIALSPLYMNYERGATSLGNGSIRAFVFIPAESYDMDFYTDIYLTLDEGGYLHNDTYESAADAMEQAVTEAGELQADKRYQGILADAWEEIYDAEEELRDGEAEYAEEKAKALQELQDALQELLEAEQDIADGAQEIADGWIELREESEKARQELLDAEEELKEAEEKLRDGEEEYEDGLKKLQEARLEYEDGLQKYNEGYQDYLDGLAEYEDGLAQYEEARRAYSSGGGQIGDAKEQLAAAQEQYEQLSGLYGAVSGIAAGMGMDPGTFAAFLQGQLAAAEAGDPTAQGTVAMLDASLSAYGMSAASLSASWQTADAQLRAQGYSEGLTQQTLSRVKASLDEGQLAYNQGAETMERAWWQLTMAKEQLNEAKDELDNARRELEDARKELEEGEKELLDGERELEDARKELDDGWQEYTDGLQEVADGWVTLEQETADAEAELRDAEAELADGRIELADGWVEYNDGTAEAEAEFADAEAELEDARREIDDAKEELNDLKKPTLYVLRRSANVGYVCFQNDASIVAGIATIFPIFFFLVAALVCITTMTRMVDEQRTETGTFKALGYGSGAIMMRFLIYSGSAALIGCTLGVWLGSFALPAVIWKAYSSMYHFSEKLLFYFDIKLAAAIVLSFVLCTFGATWYACSRDLAEAPAELIRPRAPKAGRRTVLERIPFFWNRLNFFGKVSMRNILRYKQRLFMMVLGIGGCMALLITGFGIMDSVNGVVDYQYEEITLYDGSVSFREELTEADRAEFLGECGDVIEEIVFQHESATDATADGVTKTTTLLAPETEDYSAFIDLHADGQPIPMPGLHEAVINDNLADTLGLRVGDSFTTLNSDMEQLVLKVSGIYENHVENYCIISPETYAAQLGGTCPIQSAYVNFREGEDIYTGSAKLLSNDLVGNVSLCADMRDRLATSLQSMGYIIIAVVVSAGALAFIVLYNLTNININERIREIATIKVLGFYPRETAWYVFRENIVLTLLGALAGIPMGIGLHRFVMYNVKIDLMRFDVRISLMSFVICFVLTIVFSLLVDWIMLPRLRKINMAESLKSFE